MKNNIAKSVGMVIALGLASLIFSGCEVAEESNSNKSWHTKLVAKDTATGMKSVTNRLGQISGMTDEADSRLDLKEFGGTSPKLAISFPIGSGTYKSDYHGINETDEWDLIVTSSDPQRTVTLEWSNMYEIEKVSKEGEDDRYETEELQDPMELKKMKLVDANSGEVLVSAVGADEELQTYTFEMDGQTTRTFKWVLEAEEVEVTEPLPKMAALQAKAAKKAAENVQEASQSFLPPSAGTQ